MTVPDLGSFELEAVMLAGAADITALLPIPEVENSVSYASSILLPALLSPLISHQQNMSSHLCRLVGSCVILFP